MRFSDRSPFVAAAGAALLALIVTVAPPAAAQSKLAGLPDFTDLYDFDEAFVKPFAPSRVSRSRSSGSIGAA